MHYTIKRAGLQYVKSCKKTQKIQECGDFLNYISFKSKNRIVEVFFRI